MPKTALEEFLACPLEKFQSNGTPLMYRRTGNGPPLLMIHGWPLCGATFRHYVTHLRNRFTVYVPDLPGSGESPWAPETQNMLEDWAGLMRQFTDHLGLERLAVLGHDSGGTIARFLAADLGDRVAALILCNTEISNHVSPELVRLQRMLRIPGSDILMKWLMRSRAYRRSSRGFGDAFGDLSFIEGDFHDACIDPLIGNAHGARLAFVHCDLSTTKRLSAVHARLRAPCLLVWGGRDPFFPLPLARRMLSELPARSRLEVVPEAKLLVHEEERDRVLAWTEAFLRSHFT